MMAVMSDAGRRDEDVSASATPPAPLIEPEEMWSSTPFLLSSGGKHSLGWQCWPEQEGGPSYVVAQLPAFGSSKILERYPLTEDGWAAAWHALETRDPPAAARVRKAAARRQTDDPRRQLEAARRDLDGRTQHCLPVTLLGGYLPGAALAAGTAYDLRFLQGSVAIYEPYQVTLLGKISFAEIEDVEIGGPGLVKSGPGITGGGFGLVGAAEGVAAAALLSALTTRTTITTIMRVQATRAELFLLHTKKGPQELRVELSPALGAIRQARATSQQSPEPAGQATPLDDLARLVSLLDRGLLTRAEFDQLKAKLISGLP
jgi:hypothetical protein